MLHLKMAKSVRLIQKSQSTINGSENGSLTVVAVIFVGILLSCLIFQLAAYQQEIGSINRITEHERLMRYNVIHQKQKEHEQKRSGGHE